MSAPKNMDLYTIHGELDCLITLLTEACSALDVLYEQMECEGFQQKESFEEWKAINFSRRFPMFLSTYRVIQRDLENTVKLMEINAEQIFDAYMAQKETTA